MAVLEMEKSAAEKTLAHIQNAGGEGIFVQTDVRQESQCRQAVDRVLERWGRLDVLVNNAGIYPRAAIEETTEDLWDRIMAVNLKGPFFLCKYAVPLMRRYGGGSIINIGSVNGLGGSARLFAYSISKGALLTLTKNLAMALVNDGIRVNYLIPGWVLSETEIRIQAQEGKDEQWLKNRAASLGMGRFQTPKDAAGAMVFLASDDALMITGAVINVDAGYSVRCIGAED